ncbi:hypothetical protein [Nocardioides sp.]|uniref:hypothetical protein n=1 Tax=Nocardioides sp. TaxID=35761 RepID=UPI0037842CDF
MADADQPFLTERRARSLQRVLYLPLLFAVVLVVIAVLILSDELHPYGITLLVIATAFALSGGLALRAVRRGSERARSLCVLTGALLVSLSIPLIGIAVGLLTAVAGIGLLVVVFAPEQEPR